VERKEALIDKSSIHNASAKETVQIVSPGRRLEKRRTTIGEKFPVALYSSRSLDKLEMTVKINRVKGNFSGPHW
jgi:hypothetical protein